MKPHAVVLAFAVLAAAAVPLDLRAQDVSLAGEWELVAETQKGGVNWTAVFAVAGEDLEVTMTGPRGNAVKGLGTLKGDALEWTIKVTTPRGVMDIHYQGTVTGDTMSGEVARGNQGTSNWSAKRKPAPA